MKQIQSIAIGCLVGLLVFVVLGFAYRAGRHSIVESDELLVLGAPVNARWSSVAPLPGGYGCVANPPLISTAQMDKGERPNLTAQYAAMHASAGEVRYVSMTSDDVVSIDVKLVSRDIVNRFGTSLLDWQCRAHGAVARDGSEYYLFIEPTGGGDAGYTVSFETVRIARSTFKLTITERLWWNSARQCELWFLVKNDGTIHSVDAL